MSTVVIRSGGHNLKKAILPPVIGLFTIVLLFSLFNFQRINADLRYMQASNKPVSTNSIKASDTRPRLVISKLGIEAPVLYEATGENESQFQKLLERGVVHYPFTARPDETGNTVIFGHSSNNWFSPGDYKSIFATLEKVETNDIIDLYYKGIHHRYKVSNEKIVEPSDVSVLKPSKYAKLTLITCWPVGTAAQRLIVTAERF